MASKNNQSMDGFVPRRERSELGGLRGGETTLGVASSEVSVPKKLPQVQPVHSGAHIRRSDIDDSLKSIDDVPEASKGKKRKSPEQRARRRKVIKRIVILFLLIALMIGGYIAIKAIMASGNVFKGNILGLIQHQPLKEDSNGRSNILILGTSEDDPGHQGANLTDSMMILSVDQDNKNAYMISIPRDLYVKYGRACDAGYAGKINGYYDCVHDGASGKDADVAALPKAQAFVGEITGLDIQYGVNVNYTVMRDLVNAVGGTITVNIEGNGATPYGVAAGSVMDSNFDWKCGATYAVRLKNCAPRGHFIDYGPGEQTLDAEHALYLAQARGDSAPTWGLAQSNFDREKNQQKIIKAIRSKAVSAGVLTDFTKVTALIDALGDNLRTTFETSEFQTLVDIAKNIKDDDIKSVSLIDGDNPVMTTGTVSGQSVVEPSAGTYDYSELQAYIKKNLSSNPVVRESAPIAVFNGSGVAGVAQTEADKLTAQSYNVTQVSNAPSGDYGTYTIYQIGDGNTGTAAALKKLYGVTIKKSTPPVSVSADTKFVIIIGQSSTSSSSGSAN